MKNIYFFVLFAFILCSYNDKEVYTIITGSIKGGTVEDFTLPIRETVFGGFREDVIIDERVILK